jgi:sulfonate dioxygenase
MQRYLESLTALHSAELQAQGTRDLGRTVRREPVTTEHPLIRTHPVTGWKSIFFNPGFVTKIVGVPKTESDHIISLLNEIVATSPEIHARFRWEAGDVAFWDNRVTVSCRCLGSGLKSVVLTYIRTTLLRMASRRIGDTQCVLPSGLKSRI